MNRAIIKRYSISFKRQVIDDFESGRFDTIESVRSHYGIGGQGTIQIWLRKYGKNHLLPKVVIVAKPNEKNQIRELKKKITKLEQALGQTQMEKLLESAFLELACKDLDCGIDEFKKKTDTTWFTKSKRSQS